MTSGAPTDTFLSLPLLCLHEEAHPPAALQFLPEGKRYLTLVRSSRETLSPVACGGASAVLGSQCVARVPRVVAPGVFPQVEHLALETLLQRCLIAPHLYLKILIFTN
ncbi:hypothetical protein BZZ01_21400 [Nostocales cyanobacterium HT-58-2]|nr:hypothetical protein BZZ01_21400 [Nostocales cyanobacterium HT-58-2]